MKDLYGWMAMFAFIFAIMDMVAKNWQPATFFLILTFYLRWVSSQYEAKENKCESSSERSE